MPLPANLPYPVVFGPSFPDFTMVTKGGRQTFRSRTNQNLFLDPWEFNDRGTFTMARLLRKTATASECFRLLWEHLYFDDTGEVVDWGDFNEEPQWGLSEAFTRLQGFVQSVAGRQFFLEWSRTQYARGLGESVGKWQAAMRAREPGWSWDWRHDAITFGLIDLVFDFPALIPETWLNYVGPDKTEADERHLAENPSRVDFVVFVEGRKYVIEIDGPSHYADFDEQERTYAVNEEKYAKNLAIERSLRRQGWEINRFANVEVMRASGDDFVRLLMSAELPGLAWSDDPLFLYKDRPRVYESAVGAVLELFVDDA